MGKAEPYFVDKVESVYRLGTSFDDVKKFSTLWGLKRAIRRLPEEDKKTITFANYMNIIDVEDCMVAAGLAEKQPRSVYDGVNVIHIKKDRTKYEVFMDYESDDALQRACGILGRRFGGFDSMNGELSIGVWPLPKWRAKSRIRKIMKHNPEAGFKFDEKIPENIQEEMRTTYQKRKDFLEKIKHEI